MSQIELKNKKALKTKIDIFKLPSKKTESLIETNIIYNIKNKRKKLFNYFYFSNFINIFLIEFILFILENKITSVTSKDNYIILQVNDIGEQQIFSDKYNLSKYEPYRIYVNDRIKILLGNKISLETKPSKIKIVWKETIPDFTYMFANIDIIKSITINNLLNPSSTDISYMFFNCKNIESVTFQEDNNEGDNKTQIIGETKMFYNCISLLNVSFDFRYEANNISVSEMFYNCNQLNSVNLNNKSKMILNNMTKMFFNCNSLKSLDTLILDSPENYPIDMSYLFYNCQNLESVGISSINTIITNDISYMFYNCNKLEKVILEKFEFKKSIDMSYLFYNCQKIKTIDFIIVIN